ncbi:capsule assembly Wzi family protein [Maribellus maritimus]|uniref:capsule assembly Wzi family protein n=1 Tax=Maribellus maritimus TaxID=2870838 RepID=UPI001EEAD65C|nr:capsule assembly Wzi family protein [Maribellus maritimus]MCG6188432.1 capsule assembly Wzi family protein [Maribellus maritimus]
MIKKGPCFYLFLSFLIFYLSVKGQNEPQFSISNSTFASSESSLPFGLWANQDGMVKPGESFLNLTTISGSVSGAFTNSNSWHYKAGTTLAGALGNDNYFQFNQLFAGVDYKGWALEAGMFYDEMRFGGLSSSNGNLARSRNARPVPKIRISTSGYKPVPGLQDWLFFRFEFDEGFLNDERYVDKAHLHHKSLYLKIAPAENWTIEMGAEHFVMWGGTSRNPEYGALPDDFSSYLKYITGRSGGSEFPTTDQKNVAGNQYGTYQLEISREFRDFSVHFNLSHPFEDLSGVNWRNWPDNLLGLHIKFKDNEQFLSEAIYELTNTRQQSYIETSQRWDNYYNNSVYNSGVTYFQMAMSSPLFYPVKITDGISRGFVSNRFYAHHAGGKGRLLPYIYWKAQVTYLEHFGTYSSPLHEEEVLLMAKFDYKNPSFPFCVALSLAADLGYNPGDIYGAQLSLSKSW